MNEASPENAPENTQDNVSTESNEDSVDPKAPHERVMGVNQMQSDHKSAEERSQNIEELSSMDDGGLRQDEDGAGTPVENGEESPEDNLKIQTLEAQLNDTRDKYMRAVAETENIRKRSAKERQDISKYAVSSFAKDLLAFADNFRRAVDAIPADVKDSDPAVKSTVEGIEAMERELLKMFERHGIKKIEPLDERFDPNFHEVMFESPAQDKAPGTVIQIIEPGYVLHDRLLRPARVGVAKDDGNGSGSMKGGSNLDEQY